MTDDADKYSDDLSFGFRRFQMAFWISLIAVSAHYLMFLIPGMIHRSWEGEMGGYFVMPAIFIFSAIAACGGIVWALGFKILRFVSWLIYSILGRRRVGYGAWDHVFCRSLWTLPWAFGIGAVVYIAYFGVGWGGWPDDVIVGTAGNLLGAFCYVTLFCGWYRLCREAPKIQNEQGAP